MNVRLVLITGTLMICSVLLEASGRVVFPRDLDEEMSDDQISLKGIQTEEKDLSDDSMSLQSFLYPDTRPVDYLPGNYWQDRLGFNPPSLKSKKSYWRRYGNWRLPSDSRRPFDSLASALIGK